MINLYVKFAFHSREQNYSALLKMADRRMDLPVDDNRPKIQN